MAVLPDLPSHYLAVGHLAGYYWPPSHQLVRRHLPVQLHGDEQIASASLCQPGWYLAAFDGQYSNQYGWNSISTEYINIGWPWKT